MRSKVSYIQWRNRIEEITPADHRLGTDILLIDNAQAVVDMTLDEEPFKLDMTMALIYEQGSADLKINMKQLHIEAPAVLIVLNGQIYEPLYSSEDLKTKVILMSREFSDSLFVGTSQTLSLSSAVMKDPVMMIDNEENVFDQFYQLLLNIMASPRPDFKMEAAKHITLSMFYGYSSHKHDFSEEGHSTTRQEQLYADFIDLLDKYHKAEREVAFYADKLCITPKYLSQVVKDISGKSALDIVEEYVIAECKAMLLSTAMTIQQISDELNFPSQSVFGKYFKRVTGLSPKEYRKAHPLFL